MEVERTTDGGQNCLLIRTDTSSYAYQDEAGGFSSILDGDGIDWIGFRPGPPEVPQGAGHVFRGLPNLVYPDNVGHPGYRRCRSKHSLGNTSATIDTESTDGEWMWTLTVKHDHAEFDVGKSPIDRAYWFLYEGVPAGRYDPGNTIWGTDAGPFAGRRGEARTPTRPSSLGNSRWIYFGYAGYPRVFFIARVPRNPADARLPGGGPKAGIHAGAVSVTGVPPSSPRPAESVLYFMNASPVRLEADSAQSAQASGRFAGEGMVVFGFGRSPDTRPLLRGANRFAFGFIESTRHEEIRRGIEGL